MIRSNRSIRRFCALVVATLAFSIVVPAASMASNVSPTDEEYGQGLVGATSGGSDQGVSSLPFTGLDVVAIAVIGAGLVGAGFAIRRASRTGTDAV